MKQLTHSPLLLRVASLLDLSGAKFWKFFRHSHISLIPSKRFDLFFNQECPQNFRGKMNATTNSHMGDLLVQQPVPGALRLGQLIKGIVADFQPSRVLIELENGSTGIITKRELGNYLEAGDLAVGSEVESTVIDTENPQGLVVLSLRKASQDLIWAEIGSLHKEERNFKVKVEEANKGGLMCRYKGLKSFLPVSQLTPLNYPRVENADSGEILRRLQEFIGKEFVVRVMNLDRLEGKIIVSEKLAEESLARQTLKNLKVGDTVEGTVSGVVKYGIFVTFGGVEGLVHVSELDWSHVSNPGALYSVGQKAEVMIIGAETEKLSLSIKRLSEDPWAEKGQAYSQGQAVEGKVVRWNDNGIFIEITPEIAGFFSLERLGVESIDEAKPQEGATMSGTVVEVNFDSHRLELTPAS